MQHDRTTLENCRQVVSSSVFFRIAWSNFYKLCYVILESLKEKAEAKDQCFLELTSGPSFSLCYQKSDPKQQKSKWSNMSCDVQLSVVPSLQTTRYSQDRSAALLYYVQSILHGQLSNKDAPKAGVPNYPPNSLNNIPRTIRNLGRSPRLQVSQCDIFLFRRLVSTKTDVGYY